jgi:hypothetical protein
VGLGSEVVVVVHVPSLYYAQLTSNLVCFPWPCFQRQGCGSCWDVAGPGPYCATVFASVVASGCVKPAVFYLRIEQAKNGVIFVDECYQLDPKGPAGSAGQKVLERIMDHSELATGSACFLQRPSLTLILCFPVSRHERTSTVIFAGYEGPVRDVIASNPGMPRRFQHTVVFEDYTEVEIRRSEYAYGHPPDNIATHHLNFMRGKLALCSPPRLLIIHRLPCLQCTAHGSLLGDSRCLQSRSAE